MLFRVTGESLAICFLLCCLVALFPFDRKDDAGDDEEGEKFFFFFFEGEEEEEGEGEEFIIRSCLCLNCKFFLYLCC